MVLNGVISRLDREAPEYQGAYQDFDTFYITSASSTSGGSSGSPCLDINGKCVALNSGGEILASSSFFLPLDNVVTALKHIQNGVLRPPRGSLEVSFRYVPMDEAQRLGWKNEDEAEIRRLRKTSYGVMAVNKIIPNGVGHAAGLREGDLILKISNSWIFDFTSLQRILDDASAGKSPKVLSLSIQRGAEKLTLDCKVESLWNFFPDEFLEYSKGIFHEIPYQYCLSFGIEPHSGVFVAFPGYNSISAIS